MTKLILLVFSIFYYLKLPKNFLITHLIEMPVQQNRGGQQQRGNRVGGGGSQNRNRNHHNTRTQHNQQHNQQQYQHQLDVGEQVDNHVAYTPRLKTVRVSDGYGCSTDLELSTFIAITNQIPPSTEIQEICSTIGITNYAFMEIAENSACNYMQVLDGYQQPTPQQYSLLNYYDIPICGKSVSTSMISKLAFARYNIYIIAQKGTLTPEVADFIGMIAGTCRYFDNIDYMNYCNGIQTQYYDLLRMDNTEAMFQSH